MMIDNGEYNHFEGFELQKIQVSVPARRDATEHKDINSEDEETVEWEIGYATFVPKQR